jgi:hypothetical protein
VGAFISLVSFLAAVCLTPNLFAGFCVAVKERNASAASRITPPPQALSFDPFFSFGCSSPFLFLEDDYYFLIDSSITS